MKFSITNVVKVLVSAFIIYLMAEADFFLWAVRCIKKRQFQESFTGQLWSFLLGFLGGLFENSHFIKRTNGWKEA